VASGSVILAYDIAGRDGDRQRIESDVEAYLKNGGTITEVPVGQMSVMEFGGKIDGKPPKWWFDV